MEPFGSRLHYSFCKQYFNNILSYISVFFSNLPLALGTSQIIPNQDHNGIITSCDCHKIKMWIISTGNYYLATALLQLQLNGSEAVGIVLRKYPFFFFLLKSLCRHGVWRHREKPAGKKTKKQLCFNKEKSSSKEVWRRFALAIL